MRHGACDAQGNGRTTQEAPGFGVGSLAGKSERHTFHIKLAAHQPPNAPPVVCNFGTGGSGLGFFLGGSCGPHVGHCCLSGSKVVLLFASDHLLVVEIWAAYTEQGGGGGGGVLHVEYTNNESRLFPAHRLGEGDPALWASDGTRAAAIYCPVPGGGEVGPGDWSAAKFPYFKLVRDFPRIVGRNVPHSDTRTPSSTKQTQMVKFNSWTILTLKNYCRLLCCIVCLWGSLSQDPFPSNAPQIWEVQNFPH